MIITVSKKNHNAENQYLYSHTSQKAHRALEASQNENMDTIVRSRPMDSNLNETTETDFHSTLLDDGTLFSSKL